MKKSLLSFIKGLSLVLLLISSQNAFAEILYVEEVYNFITNQNTTRKQEVHLSDGKMLIFYKNGYVLYGKDCSKHSSEPVDCTTNRLLKKGDMIFKSTSGKSFSLVEKRYLGTYAIKKLSFHMVKSLEVVSLLESVYTYRGWVAQKRSTENEKRTQLENIKIANVFFSNGSSATIPVNEDPLWLDAEIGMKVKHYKILNDDIYELSFNKE